MTDLPGSLRPERRLPVTLRSAWERGAARGRLRRPAPAFPLVAPTWPGRVPRPPLERNLGVDYDTDWSRRYPTRVARALVQEVVSRPLVHALASPRVTGLDRIAHLDEPVIFAANHESHVDAPLVLTVVPERWRHRMFVAGAADYFFDTRAKALAFAFLLNAIPVERQRVSRASANRAAALLREGWSLLIFPEGGRSPDGWAQAHRAGAAWLAVRTGRPVVPLHIEGTRQILARGSKRVRPGDTSVAFGRPLRTAQGGDPRVLAVEIEQAIASLADEQATDWWTARRRAAARTTPSLTGPDAGAWRRAWALGDRRDRRGDRRVSARWPWG
ncbi:MAG: lysophospholipid acyltransferase family protein [Acidimicrobiales bacterium]